MKKRRNYLTNHKYNVLVCALVAVCVLCLSLGLSFGLKSVNSYGSLGETGIKDEYVLGEKLNIAKADVTVDGSTYSVQPIVYFPDGTARQDSAIDLNSVGKYVLDYAVTVGGKVVSNQKEFFVRQYLAENVNTKESLTFAKDEQYNVEGLQFSLKTGEIAKYNKMVDFSKMTSAEPFITLDALPKTAGKAEANYLIVKVTDAYDDSNFFNIRLNYSPDPGDHNANYGYVKASAFGQQAAGWVTATWLEIGDTRSYGTTIKNGLKGINEKSENIKYYIDYANKTLYLGYGDKTSKIINLETDIDVPQGSVKVGGKAWQGFTTGEAFISVYAESYASASAPFNGVILDIAGEDLKAGVGENGELPLLNIDKTLAPVVDFGAYGDNEHIFDGLVGYKYKLFDSKVYSAYGYQEVTTHVYYGYNTSTRYEVSIVDGAFTPSRPGVYTIVYATEDCFGNTAETLVDVKVIEATGVNFELEVPNVQNYNAGTAGAMLAVAPLDTAVYSGNMGFVDLSVSATHKSSGKTLEIVDDSFLPELGGEWVITYGAIDALGRTAEFKYSAQVDVSEEVLFLPVYNLYKYMIVGADNPIPSADVIDYNDNAKIKSVDKIFVKKGNEKVADVTNGYFKPTSAGVYTVVYEAKSAVNVTAYNSIEVEAIDVGFKTTSFSLSKYFYSDSLVSAVSKTSGTTLTVKTNEIVEFIRPLDGVNFTTTFNTGDMVNANIIELNIADVNDASKTIKLEFKKAVAVVSGANKDVVAMSLNGGEWKTLSLLTFKEGADVNIKISDGEVILGETATTIKTYANGNEFKGFDSQTVYLSFTAVGEAGLDYSFTVTEVTGQYMDNTKEDMTSPRLLIPTSMKNRILKGESFVLEGIKILDVIDPKVSSKLIFSGPDGTAYKDVNGLSLDGVDVSKDYTIKLDDTGIYRKRYIYNDTSNNGDLKGKAEVINVISTEKPTINLEKTVQNARLGDKIRLEEVTVSSTYTQNIKIYVFVKVPGERYKELKKFDDDDRKGQYNYEITATVVGEYFVRYMAIDEWENMSVKEYKIIVE